MNKYKTFEVVVDMPRKFDAGFLKIALVGMMIKIISCKEIKKKRWEMEMKPKEIEITGIRYAVIEGDTIATDIMCQCFSGSICKKRNKKCKRYKIIAKAGEK